MTPDKADTTRQTAWSAPVRIRIGYGMPEPVRDPDEALYYLKYRWPTVRGRHYRGAIANCNAALKRQLTSELAREAFVTACKEAAMLN